MLILLNKNKERIAALTQLNDYVIKQKINKEEELSFSLFLYDENIKLIEEECYIETKEQRYIVKAIKRQSTVVRYECKQDIEDLKSRIYIDGFECITSTVGDTLRLALAGTGWTVDDAGAPTKKRSMKLDATDCYDIIQKTMNKFICEYQIDTKNKIIRTKEKFGANLGAYMSDELNLKALNTTSDTLDFATRLYVRGKDGLTFADINGGKDYVENFQYSNKVINAIWMDGRYTDKQSLLDDAKYKLAELSKPKKSYDVDVMDLAKIDGNYNFLSYSLGDTVVLMSARNAFKDEQRIVELTIYPLEPTKNSAIIANKTLSFEELQKQAQEAQDKVDGFINEDGTINGNMVDGLPGAGDLNIPDDSIEAKHIKSDAIETKHLQAGSVTAGKIKAGEIDATHIKAGTITANSAIIDDAAIGTAKIADAAITNAKIADAAIDSAKIDVGQINSAHIQDAAIGTAQIADAAITVAKIQDLFVDDLVANQGKFNSAHIGELEAGNIKAGAITTDKLAAGSVVADKIAAGAISTDKLAANSITSDKIAAGTIVAGDIAANAITTEKINAGAVTAGKVAADAITAGNIQAGAITAGKLAANSVEAGNIKAGAITADKIGANAITTDKLAANSVTADKIKAGAVEADKISANAVNAIAVSAGSIVANDITTGAIKISNANILDGTINGAKITSASITNAQIKDATIESAKIASLNAGKITTGTLDATKVAINSTSGRLSIADNTITIKDAQTTPKTRVQIGKDSRNKYGILVMNAAGEAIFDSDYGVLSDKGLSDGVVSTDKIVDEAVAPSKIQIKELWAEEAYINEFNGQTINADNITTGTISGERIDIKGLISFEALDEDLSKLFVPGSGNGTVINGGFIGADTIKANSIDLYSGLNVRKQDGTTSFAIAENGEVSVNGLLRSGNYKPGVSGYQVETTGKAEFNEATIRGSIDLPNAGMTNEGTLDTSVRIWAGDTFENRDLAKFKVLQNGAVLATDGTFSGRVYGNYDNDNIHIHNNEIVIDNTSTFLDYEGQEQSIAPLGDTSDNPHIKLAAGQSILNTDVVFGSSNDKKIQFSNDARALILNNSLISGTRVNGSIKINDGSYSNHFNGIELDGKTGGNHMIGYYDSASFLKFESRGNAYHPSGKEYDFVFEGAGARNKNINILVDGDVTVEKAVKSNKQNIEMRSVANEGWGFYAT